MNRTPTLAVLIRSHNAKERICHCVDTIYTNQVVKPDMVYICDDHSDDGTWELLQEEYGANPHFVLMRNDSNLGPGATMKRAIMACTTEYYMLIDDDDVWKRDDVIQRVKSDLVATEYPDKIYYRANDVCNWRLHSIFAYKTRRMQELTYFSLWCNDDDYTLQTLSPSFREVIFDDYIFIPPYVGHGISRLRPTTVYRYIHQICKNIYMGNVDLARDMYDKFPFWNECSPQDLVIVQELRVYFSTNNDIGKL